ncbi:ECF-type sigma factor [Arenimonas sp.]|uniref:ECF-type sigma factor n=1 Tax=Arenimonas sp. TaxID=1872635 RepID=UPI0025DA1D0C|nr:ECF-type sigma factor [Arenimonas sp.]
MHGTDESPATPGAQAVPASLDGQIYAQLRSLARRHIARWGPGVTASPTTIVHEAYLRLSGHGGGYWDDRAHFLAVASRAMRQLLVDKARRRTAGKRGGGALHLVELEVAGDEPVAPDTLLSVEDALCALEQHDASLARVVECRFYAGLSVAETALALGRSQRSIERDWTRARAYLLLALGD